MEIKITKRSLELINTVLEKTSIYTMDELPTETSYKDSGSLKDNQFHRLRAQWLYDKYGFYYSAINYTTFPKRVFEYFTYGDFLNTLRQRLNIIHEMMNCDFDTYTPVHISIGLGHDVERPGRNILNLHSSEDMLDFDIVAHPGQTRLQASVFLQRPLTRFLIYINKSIQPKIKFNTKGLKEITSAEELLTHYRVRDNRFDIENPDTALIDFEMPWMPDKMDLPLKYHRSTGTHILKMNDVTVSKKDEKDAAHPSVFYMADSFITTDSYFRILTNNELNIYTDNPTQTENVQFYTKNILQSSFTGNASGENAVFSYLSGYREYGEFFNQNMNLDSSYHLDQLIGQMSQNDNFTGTDEKIVSDIDYIIKKYGNKKFGWNYNIIKEEPNTPEYYVKLNNYKGFCLVINNGDYIRTYEELFMVAHPNFAMTRSNHSKIMIINCEHEYWRTGKNYTDYILTDNFFSNDNRIQNSI